MEINALEQDEDFNSVIVMRLQNRKADRKRDMQKERKTDRKRKGMREKERERETVCMKEG